MTPSPETSDEPLRVVDFAPTDALLREDVNMLGALVGEILAEQRGPAFLAAVETLRRAAIVRREAHAPVDGIAAALANIELEQAGDLVRAFATYFQAVNLAERVHRIRRRRDHERSGDRAQPGGLRDVISGLAKEGVGADELAALLPRLRIEPVFTAHPTEAVRRVLLEKERQIVGCLVADIDRGRTPGERRADRERIRLALTASWQTAEAPPQKPSVADEFEHVGFDLSDMSGYAYYSGARFAIYGAGCSDALARGGRYDEVGAVFGRNRPAVGFSLDLKTLAEVAGPSRAPAAIRAPWGEDPELRAALRRNMR